MQVKDLMTRDVIITVTPDTPVKRVSELMLEHNVGGIPVVDASGALIGIVTEEDLIIKDAKIHFPTYIKLLDAVIYLGSIRRYEDELRKALGATAGDVMTPDPIFVSPDDDIEEAATLMLEKGISRLPVVERGQLVGIITKRDIVRSLVLEEPDGA